MYIILNNYSNESICEFNRINVIPTIFGSLEAAKAEAIRRLKDDEDANITCGDATDNEGMELAPEDCGQLFDDSENVPVFIIGRYEEQNFDASHNIYAVIEVNRPKRVIEPGKKYVYFFRSDDGNCKELVKYNGRLCTVVSENSDSQADCHQGLYEVEFDEIPGVCADTEFGVYGEELEEIDDCVKSKYGIYFLREF